METAAPDNCIWKHGPNGFDRCQFEVSDERFHRTDRPGPLNQCRADHLKHLRVCTCCLVRQQRPAQWHPFTVAVSVDSVDLVGGAGRHLESSVADDVLRSVQHLKFCCCPENQKAPVLPTVQQEPFPIVRVGSCKLSTTHRDLQFHRDR